MSVEELASKGPLKPEELRGLDPAGFDEYVKSGDITVTTGLEKMEKEMPRLPNTTEKKDENNYRTGWVLDEELTKKMLAQAMVMKELIHESSVAQKRFLNRDILMEQIDLTRGLMMMCYPGFHGLASWEPVCVILENKEEFDEKISMNLTDDLNPAETTLWCVSKELQRGKYFWEQFGKNEKSKMIIKATKVGGGAPVKEPMIDEETHKKMLAFYHKKNEEQKKLEEADEGDHHMNSGWADSGNMKRALHG